MLILCNKENIVIGKSIEEVESIRWEHSTIKTVKITCIISRGWSLWAE